MDLPLKRCFIFFMSLGVALIREAALKVELLWRDSFKNVGVFAWPCCGNQDALTDPSQPHCSLPHTIWEGWRCEPAGQHCWTRESIRLPLSLYAVEQEWTGQLQALVYYYSLLAHPPYPFSSVTGQADLIWHPSIWDLSSTVTLSSTNIENYTWDLCDPDVCASKAKMKWQAWGVGGAELGECVWKDPRGVYSQVEVCILIFSLKNSNWIMKCSFK